MEDNLIMTEGKKCIYNIAAGQQLIIECGKDAKYECKFIEEYTRLFCKKHFEDDIKGCENLIAYRKINSEKWRNLT